MNEPTSGENHDWDLTMKAAFMLLENGYALDQQPRTGTLSMGFAHFTGSMMLSFAGIESFSASTAFCMSRDAKFAHLDYEQYRRHRYFKDKIEYLFANIPAPVDWSQGLFQKIKEMQDWRNLVAHSSPYGYDETTPKKGSQQKTNSKTYLDRVQLIPANTYYGTAVKYIEHLEALTGIRPTTHAVFQVGPAESTG